MEGPSVPETVAVGSRLILPGIAPVGGDGHQDRRRIGNRWLLTAGREENTAVIALSEPPQSEVMRSEMVDPTGQIRKFPANEIEIDVVKGSRVGMGAEGDHSPGVRLLLGNAS